MKTKQQRIDDFWSQVNITDDPDECWEWTGSFWPNKHTRYGQARSLITGKWTTAQRVAWELINGPIPAKQEVCHSCDNPACCNYKKHLWLGTHKENLEDSRRKGRINTEEHRKATSIANIGNKHMLGYVPTVETRKKLSEAGKGRVVSEETRKALSEALTGRQLSDETKAKVSAAKKGKPSTFKGKQHSDEAKKMIGEAEIGNKKALGHTVSAEAREKISAGNIGNKNATGHVITPEVRQKMELAKRLKRLKKQQEFEEAMQKDSQ
jgi:hypothetical protein